MIESLHLENFQSHRDSSFNFDPGVNVIVGPSDSGKSAIIRALRWLATNRPAGDAFRSWGSGKAATIVSAVVDGSEIHRRRGNTKNAYLIIGEEDKAFTAFGQDVPEEIRELLDLSDVNWQLQHDSSYLLSASPGDVARTLNEAADLEVIDHTLANLTSRTRQAISDESRFETRVSNLEKELNELDWLDDAEKELKALEQLWNEAVELEEVVESMQQVLNTIEGNEKEIQEVNELASADIDQLVSLCSQRDELHDKIEALSDSIDEYEGAKNLLSKMSRLLNERVQVLRDKWPSLCPLCGAPMGECNDA